MRVLVTGATGYIGGRLVPQLLGRGHQVRVLVRDRKRVLDRSWSNQVEIVEGDARSREDVVSALENIEAAYYLIHSMSGSDDFHERDLQYAKLFGEVSQGCGVQQIVYLGGLGDSSGNLSKHLASRQQTGEMLRSAGVPVTEFRAAIVVGSGSASFEMIRNLAERIPIMICPKWVFTRIQPIAIRDVIAYLVAALDQPKSLGKIIEIGGADVLTYGDMMLQYAEVRGLKRVLLPVPVLSPRLSSYWVHWMTPISAQIARPLIEGIRNEVVVQDDKAKQLFPDVEPLGYRAAVARALDSLNAGSVESSWSDSLSSSLKGSSQSALEYREGMIIEKRQVTTQASCSALFKSITQLGGESGWLYANFLWRVRGVVDRLFGGVGFRRGRRDPTELRIGDAVDFWRVEEIQPDRSLLLRAEMKLPGQAWLQFEATPGSPDSNGKAQLTQQAFFAPKGLGGLLYWYGLYPIHSKIFSGLIERIAERAEQLDVDPS